MVILDFTTFLDVILQRVKMSRIMIIHIFINNLCLLLLCPNAKNFKAITGRWTLPRILYWRAVDNILRLYRLAKGKVSLPIQYFAERCAFWHRLTYNLFCIWHIEGARTTFITLRALWSLRSLLIGEQTIPQNEILDQASFSTNARFLHFLIELLLLFALFLDACEGIRCSFGDVTDCINDIFVIEKLLMIHFIYLQIITFAFIISNDKRVTFTCQHFWTSNISIIWWYKRIQVFSQITDAHHFLACT